MLALIQSRVDLPRYVAPCAGCRVLLISGDVQYVLRPAPDTQRLVNLDRMSRVRELLSIAKWCISSCKHSGLHGGPASSF